MKSLGALPIVVLSILSGPPSLVLDKPIIDPLINLLSMSIRSMIYMLLLINKATQGLVALSISPFLVIDDNI